MQANCYGCVPIKTLFKKKTVLGCGLLNLDLNQASVPNTNFWVWQLMSVVPAYGRLKQEHKLLQGQDQSGLGSGEFMTSLCFRVILYLKNTKSQTTQKWAQVVFVGHTLT